MPAQNNYSMRNKTLRQVELSAPINMAPSEAASPRPYVGHSDDTPAKQAASLFTVNTIYVAFYMGPVFLPDTHTLARAHVRG